jgi:MFS family permease
VTSVFYLSYGAFEIPTGVLGDRIGPRRVLTRIVLWWSAFTTLTGTVSNYTLLLIVRFCFGIGEAGAYPNASTVIARWIPPDRRARAWGTVWLTAQIGAASAPLLVVPIQMRYGWRASFFVFGILGVVWAAVWYWWFRDWPREMSRVTPAERREIEADASPGHSALPWRQTLADGTLWRITGIGMSYVYSIAFFQSLAPDLSGAGAWLHGSCAHALVAAVSRGRAGQRP